MNIKEHKEYFRSILFGVEDSLISTTGFVAGVSIGSINPRIILFSVLLAICIEGFSMGVGEYLSDDAVEELDKLKRPAENPLLSGVFLCVSYLLAGLIPLFPMTILPFPISLILSVILAFLGLFLLGYVKGRLLKVSPYRGAFKILVVGGITTICGIILGLLFKF